jgi:coenzyme F420-dependent glucose-6-phosphate dehydrogenase
VVDAFRRGGGEGKPMLLKVQLSYDRTDDLARQGAFEQWRTNVFESHLLSDLRTPQQFDTAAQYVTPDQLDQHIRISSDVQQHIEWLQQDIELGFDELLLHNVNRQQEQYIEVFGEKVVPVLGENQPTLSAFSANR